MMKKTKTKSRSREKRDGTKPYRMSELPPRSAIVSSVCSAGVAESRRLYRMSAKTIPTPKAGSKASSLPRSVMISMIRPATENRTASGLRVFGQRYRLMTAPPITTRGSPTDAADEADGGFRSKPTPAEAMTSATRTTKRWCRARNSVRVMRPGCRSFADHFRIWI